MSRLYCEEHGREQDARSAAEQESYREAGECVLVVSGRLVSGPWACDRCNQTLTAGKAAYLITALPGWVADGLIDYDFGYERAYFAMRKADTAIVYGADWPDDSIRHRRPLRPSGRHDRSPPLCALDIKAK